MNKLICEYDNTCCKFQITSIFEHRGYCQTHGKVFLYTKEELERAYQSGIFTRPNERKKSKKKPEPVRY